MSFLLFLGYLCLGICIVIGACGVLGTTIGAMIALARVPWRSANFLVFVQYLASGFITALLVWGAVFLAGWIGDHTDYRGQNGLIVGAIFPGLTGLRLIPELIGDALRQTAGIQAGDGEPTSDTR